jgi:20S proteasome subunit alpha 7
MSGIGTGYDLSCTTYSPEGKIFQIEYASKAVENSGTAVGVRCKDGVILGVEKLIVSKMLEPSGNRRIYSVDLHIGATSAGLTADAKHLVVRARQEAKQFKKFYDSPIPSQLLCDRISNYAQAHTLYASVRPFGVCLLLAGWDQDGPHLHMIEPSGLSFGYQAVAAGKAKQGAKAELEKLKLSEMTAREAVFAVAKIIYLIHDEVKDKDFELELSWICKESNYQHKLVPADLLQEAEKAAKQAKESQDMDQ